QDLRPAHQHASLVERALELRRQRHQAGLCRDHLSIPVQQWRHRIVWGIAHRYLICIAAGATARSGADRWRERRRAMGIMIDFVRPDGGSTKGYLASAGNNRPGIVIIQEWWGLNDQICGVADRFAR